MGLRRGPRGWMETGERAEGERRPMWTVRPAAAGHAGRRSPGKADPPAGLRLDGAILAVIYAYQSGIA